MSGFLRRTAGNLARTVGQGEQRDAGGMEDSRLPFPVYLINLARADYRRRFALKQLTELGAVPAMVDAVDGRLLDLDELIRQGVYNPEKSSEAFSRQLSMPEIGCSLSHYNVYRRIVERGDQAALILEDDALFLDGFAEKLLSAVAELPTDWGVLNLNCPCTRYEQVGKSIVKYNGVGSLPVACSAYLVSQRGARLLVDNALPIRYPADSLVGRGLRWGVETYGVVPAIASINNIFPTQIQTPVGLRGRIKAWVKIILSKIFFRAR